MVSKLLTTSLNSVAVSGWSTLSFRHRVQYVSKSCFTVGAADRGDLGGDLKMLLALRCFLPSAMRAHSAAFCCRFSACTRCVVPFPNIAEVTRAMWATVARGAAIAV